MEFDDLKEYTYGDDVHDIDWKSSSRMGSILVRRYMTDRRHNVMFVCDRGAKLLGETPKGESKKELMLMTFGTLAYIVGRNGADFAMATAGDHGAKKSFFKSGTDHLEKLLYDYEQVAGTDSSYSLNSTLEEVLNTVHKRMIIFLLTDFEGLVGLNEGLVRSITTGNDLLIINIDDAYLTGDRVFDYRASKFGGSLPELQCFMDTDDICYRYELVNMKSKKVFSAGRTILLLIIIGILPLPFAFA